VVVHVYDREGVVPDLLGRQTAWELAFYVRAYSTWHINKSLHPIQLHELFGIWDYACKLQSTHPSLDASISLINL